MFNISGSKVILTGATGGIGKEILAMLTKAQANIVITGTKKDVLEQMAEKYSNVTAFPCDLFDSSQIEEFFKKAVNHLEGLDIIICNAGIAKDNLALRMKDEEWQDVMTVNLTATFKLNRLAIRQMMKKRYGRVINISSIIGYSGNIGQSNYAAAKAGIIAMSKSLALETAAMGITVNCIAPGFIDTAMTESLSNKIKEQVLSRIPMAKTGKPADIAAGVAYLASKEASYVTGSTLHINGGMAMI